MPCYQKLATSYKLSKLTLQLGDVNSEQVAVCLLGINDFLSHSESLAMIRKNFLAPMMPFTTSWGEVVEVI